MKVMKGPRTLPPTRITDLFPAPTQGFDLEEYRNDHCGTLSDLGLTVGLILEAELASFGASYYCIVDGFTTSSGERWVLAHAEGRKTLIPFPLEIVDYAEGDRVVLPHAPCIQELPPYTGTVVSMCYSPRGPVRWAKIKWDRESVVRAAPTSSFTLYIDVTRRESSAMVQHRLTRGSR